MMAMLAADELVKPDIQAVLSRTHLAYNLHDFLLPTFEAVSNAMHSIEAKFNDRASQLGMVRIHFIHPNNPSKLRIAITDNGIGLDDDNYKSFKTPFSGYKLKQYGRGFGRFIAFKVFGRSIYWSRYEFFKKKSSRSFQFDISRDKEFIFFNHEPKFDHSGVSVEYAREGHTASSSPPAMPLEPAQDRSAGRKAIADRQPQIDRRPGQIGRRRRKRLRSHHHLEGIVVERPEA